MTTEIETVLFDLDNTLCEHRRSGAQLLTLAFEREGVEPFFDIEDYRSRYNDFTEITASIKTIRADCFAAIAEDHGRDPDLGRTIAATYADERDYHNVRSFSGVSETISSLAHDHRLGIVTNGPPDTQTPKLEALGLREAFDVVIHGGVDAPLKPAPDPFRQALSELDTTPDAAVHVGDSLSSDVAGAQAAGLQAVWLADDTETDPDPVPEYTLESISELNNPPWRSG